MHGVLGIILNEQMGVEMLSSHTQILKHTLNISWIMTLQEKKFISLL